MKNIYKWQWIQVFQAVLTGWALGLLFLNVVFSNAQNLAELFEKIPVIGVLLIFIIFSSLMFIVIRIFQTQAPFLCLGIVFLYFLYAAADGSGELMAVGLAGVFLALAAVLLPEITLRSTAEYTWRYYAVAAALFILFTGGITVLRYLTFRAPCFDMGIFAQMFEQMRKTGLPVTTCERNMPLSHFAVHLSPIYYLILPVYMLFPHPATLQIVQAAVLASGAIPLFLLCRQFSLGEWPSRFIAIGYFCYPALSGGCFYDFHENFFLAPLLLWLFLAAGWQGRKKYWSLLFALLICLIKEDAPIYVAFWGLYLLVSRKRPRLGGVLFALACIYFCGAIYVLDKFGLGAMVGRYNNYSYLNGGFFEVIITCLMRPAYILEQCLQADRITYILMMLVPLLGLPLKRRKLSQWILLGPFLLVNLMPNYQYQHSVDFQYNFGSLSFLFYMTILTLSEIRCEQRRFRLGLGIASVTILLFTATQLDRLGIVGDWYENRHEYALKDELLELIPEEASVSASSMIVTHLYRHDELYPLSAQKETDYVVFDLDYDNKGMTPETYIDAGYEVFFVSGSFYCLKKTTVSSQ